MPIYRFKNTETGQYFSVGISHVPYETEELDYSIRFALKQTGWSQDKLTCTLERFREDVERWVPEKGVLCRHVLFGPVFLYDYVTSGNHNEEALGRLRIRYLNPLTGQIDAAIVTPAELRWDPNLNV
jgi:hypothetical protein